MKVPRDVSGAKLIKLLEIFGYHKSRQSGSHVRLTSRLKSEHHLTVPLHDELRLGTLNSVITEVANHLSLTKDEVLRRLFG